MTKKNNTETAQKALSYSCRLLALRPRSEKELKDRLLRKSFGRAVAEGAVTFLKEKGLLDDAKFARAWIESRMNTRPAGKMLLRSELRAKGVAGSVVDAALAEAESNEGSLAMELARQRSGRLRGLPKDEARRKLFGFLARRGFSFDVITEVVNECVK